MPAANSDSVTMVWYSGDSSSSGNRSVPPINPMRDRAHFTGVGLGSTNKFRCSATRRWSICVAPARSPRIAAATMSAIARGATLAVTEITPQAPTPMISRAVRSSPLRMRKSAAQELASSRTAIRSHLGYSNRYPVKGPDDLIDLLAKVHSVKPENVLLGCGSGELWEVPAAGPRGRRRLGERVLHPRATGGTRF